MKYYGLKGKEIVEYIDQMTWIQENNGIATQIKETVFDGLDIRVSTSFLSVRLPDMEFLMSKNSGVDVKPTLFETMVFGGSKDQAQDRYQSFDEAVEGHRKMCIAVAEAEMALKNTSKSDLKTPDHGDSGPEL